MKKLSILTLLLAIFSLSACNDWLDVRPDTEQRDEDQFSTEQGFYDAIVGAYMEMSSQDIYGERMTMTNIESLANQWLLSTGSMRDEDAQLSKHAYNNVEYAQAAIKTIYAKLFNVIAQANMIIKNVDERGDVILDPAVRYTLQGEAYAMRAYCQLDVLRLFGQVPGGSTQVMLPYSETTGIDEMPPYYDFNAYVEKLKADIAKAEELLRENDPVMTYTFERLNESYDAPVGDNMLYRQSRLNYWAVKALEARMYLYIGDKAKAAGFVDADGIKMETHYVKVQLPDSVTPDEYEVSVVLDDASCGNDTVVVPFSVLYPADIMKQKWNNVVALKNELYNGGYVFSSYQWYRNGTPMDGETGSYIYLGEGVAFAEGDEFRVEVTRASDGVRLMSCPLLVEPHEDVQTYPSLTVVGLTSPVPMENVGSPVRVRIWSVAGIYYGEQEVSPSHPYFVAPDVPGVYVLKIESGGESALYRIIVKR